MADELRSDRFYTGDVIFGGTIALPPGSIENEDIALGANIAAEKLRHRHSLHHRQANGADVASATEVLHVARADGELLSIEARVTIAPTGGDKQFTVDVQKADDASGSWASVLSAVLTFDAGTSADDTLKTAILDGAQTLLDGQALRVVVAASGSTGSQGQGLCVAIHHDEDPS